MTMMINADGDECGLVMWYDDIWPTVLITESDDKFDNVDADRICRAMKMTH